jgi:anti-anti-sigma factor
MEISSSKKERGVLMALAGRMDTVAAPEFEKACDPFLRAGEKTIVLDLSGLEYISSMGLGYLLSVNKKLQAAGGRLIVCGLTGLVKEVFRISGFNKLFQTYETTGAAFEQM